MNINYAWKLKKLKQIVDTFIHDEASLTSQEVRTALIAISEMNKMQGHYSPEKHVNVNIKTDPDLQQLEDLIKQHGKEY
ncbi:hypothetical protein [Rickettsiella endosymbiont of Rhagonycha lignosa]|uniref:hypothetical protein n=1 Tax=Rickettsiella endosymbiont of Rhagonycha lignosa TaxID=3077937 RepID=UPI00313E5456